MLLTLPIREVVSATGRATVVRLDLAGHAFPFEPGQVVTIAAHGAEPRRPYSLASTPDDARQFGYLELLVGTPTDALAGPPLPLASGALLDVEGPFGRFTCSPGAESHPLLFIAGGTGIAPVRSMYRHALARGHADIAVVYSARTPDDFAYADELRALAGAGRLTLRMTVTREAEHDWSGQRGRIDATLLQGLVRTPDTWCFICGPRALVDEIPKALGQLGVPAEHIHIEEW